MLSALILCILFSYQLCQATFFPVDVGCPGVQWFRNPRCGPLRRCPKLDCRLLQPIVLGYCCGCALPIDYIPMVCPLDVPCPTDFDPLCTDYNYLMNCCC